MENNGEGRRYKVIRVDKSKNKAIITNSVLMALGITTWFLAKIYHVPIDLFAGAIYGIGLKSIADVIAEKTNIEVPDEVIEKYDQQQGGPTK